MRIFYATVRNMKQKKTEKQRTQ